MGSLTEAQKVDFVFKAMMSKARGTNDAAYFEEGIPTATDVNASEVFADTIPSIPPASTTNTVKRWYPADEGGDGWITMTRDRAVDGGRKWVALDTFEGNWSSGSGDVTRVQKDFISPKYGSGFVVKVLDGNGNAIPELDSSLWTFNYRAGVLTFDGSDRSESGSNDTDSIKIKVFQFVGNTQQDINATIGGDVTADFVSTYVAERDAE